MFYVLYEIRNNLNGKIYVGVHKTRDLNDGYMGSGKVINAAIAKYGIDNFTKTILEQFETSAAMFAREKEIVTDEFLLREDTYNLRRGGTGGFDYINKAGLSYRGYDSAKEKSKAISPFGKRDRYSKEWNEHLTRRRAEGLALAHLSGRCYKFTQEVNIELNKRSQSASAKNKRNATLAEINHQQGEKNSQFGSVWITNEQENKKIKKTDLIPAGWRKGRVPPSFT